MLTALLEHLHHNSARYAVALPLWYLIFSISAYVWRDARRPE